jgi:hypothetical protein
MQMKGQTRMDEKPEETKSEAMKQVEHRLRMRHDWHNLIDDLVREGQDKGLFDNLPGKGKPLDLNRNLYAADKELAHALLKENDMPPAWIAERNEILAAISQLQTEVERQWAWHRREFKAVSAAAKGRLTISWDDYCLKWLSEIAELNKKIDTFNLKRPTERLEIFKLSLEKELERAGAPRWLR